MVSAGSNVERTIRQGHQSQKPKQAKKHLVGQKGDANIAEFPVLRMTHIGAAP